MAFFTFDYGQFPWIALALAFSFGIYGAIKKKAGYPATPALAFESTVMIVPALVFAVVLANVTGTHAFASDLATSHGCFITSLLVLAGPATAVPLILFAKAANLIPLTLLGFIQYLSPTIALPTSASSPPTSARSHGSGESSAASTGLPMRARGRRRGSAR